MPATSASLVNSSAKSTTQVDQVVARLTDDIIACRLLPDAKLHIASLAEHLGVSLGAVREALAALAAEGLVVAQPQKGYRVSPISGKSLLHLVQARVDIECLCLAEAIKHGDLQWERRCLAALDALKQLRPKKSGMDEAAKEARIHAHDDFHYALVSGCPNEWLLRIQHNLYQQSERYRRLTNVIKTPKPRDIDSEHQELLDIVLARDVDGACALLTKHLMQTAKAALDSPLLDGRES